MQAWKLSSENVSRLCNNSDFSQKYRNNRQHPNRITDAVLSAVIKFDGCARQGTGVQMHAGSSRKKGASRHE